MKVIARAACLSSFASVLCLAGSWSGWLVSAKCFASMDANRNSERMRWDQNLAIRYCTPDKDTKSFTVVLEDGPLFKFDSAENQKAAERQLSLGKHFLYFVRVATPRLVFPQPASELLSPTRTRKRSHKPGAPGPLRRTRVTSESRCTLPVFPTFSLGRLLRRETSIRLSLCLDAGSCAGPAMVLIQPKISSTRFRLRWLMA